MNELVDIITGKITDLKMERDSDLKYSGCQKYLRILAQIDILESCLTEYFLIMEGKK